MMLALAPLLALLLSTLLEYLSERFNNTVYRTIMIAGCQWCHIIGLISAAYNDHQL